MINIKPHDFIFFQDLSAETTTIVFIFRGCDHNTKLDSSMNILFFLSIFKCHTPWNQKGDFAGVPLCKKGNPSCTRGCAGPH